MAENPSAFPNGGITSGMTLRDWFAASAPITYSDAVRACGWDEEYNPNSDDERSTIWAVMSLLRYEYADAMLAQRSQP